MIFTLEVLPAQEGDCLLLHWGTKDAPRLAVIDGGPSKVFENTLAPRLEEIRTNRELEQLTIDITMVSHVDNDHVVGIDKLFRKLQEEVEGSLAPNLRKIAISRLWHNTFNDIIGDKTNALYNKMTASFTASASDGAPHPEIEKRIKAEAEQRLQMPADDADDLAHDISMVLAGHAQGRSLRNAHAVLRTSDNSIPKLNNPFKDGNGAATLIMSGAGNPKVKVKGLQFHVVGPAKAQIEKLQAGFDKFLETKGLSAEAVLAGYTDKSVPNLSSIVTMVEVDGKRILLTGDARGDHIIEGLEAEGFLNEEPLKIDVLKVPHHGSDRNIDKDFFERVVAETYVFSADGKHGNPDRDTLEWLVDARGKSAKYTIALTYPIKHIDAGRKAHFEKVGASWTKSKHSLEAFFAQCKADGFKFKLLEAAPHLIELGSAKIDW